MRHTIALLALLLAPLEALRGAGNADAKPNIVIIVADDLGYADVLFNPRHPQEVTMPHLDSLAKETRRTEITSEGITFIRMTGARSEVKHFTRNLNEHAVQTISQPTYPE